MICPACHHWEHDPGSCPLCPRCELHYDEALAWLQRHVPDELAHPGWSQGPNEWVGPVASVSSDAVLVGVQGPALRAAPVAEGQEDGLEDALRELIRVARSAGMSEGSDFGYLPSQRQADAEEISEAVQGVYRALAAPPSPPATVAEGQEVGPHPRNDKCWVHHDPDCARCPRYWIRSDAAPPSPPASIDVERLARALARCADVGPPAYHTPEQAEEHWREYLMEAQEYVREYATLTAPRADSACPDCGFSGFHGKGCTAAVYAADPAPGEGQ